ncbi:hypothetical protein RB195_015974 [Necator americanus]|uniref:Uncharacterized protein n=1 Tax=Necator americanus TaxID=51031 RepID=A0ABR1E717_NECAM
MQVDAGRRPYLTGKIKLSWLFWRTLLANVYLCSPLLYVPQNLPRKGGPEATREKGKDLITSHVNRKSSQSSSIWFSIPCWNEMGLMEESDVLKNCILTWTGNQGNAPIPSSIFFLRYPSSR